MSVVSILYNYQLMKLAGQDGLAAYGAVMYVSFVLVSVFLGYAIGVAPLVAYNYGAKRTDELKNLFNKSNMLTAVVGVGFAIIAFVFAQPLAKFFLGAETSQQNPKLISMTVDAFRYFSVALLFCGFSIFGSAFFTALNNGLVSAIISFLRMFVFQIVSILILPIIFGINGVWASLFVAEVLTIIVTLVFFITMRKKYNY